MKINENYLKLEESYLFSTIAHKVAAYQKANPQKKIIRMGIGDVTLPLCPAVVTAMRDAAAESERLSEISCTSRLIVNNFKYRLVKRGIFRNIDDIIDSAGLRLLGVVPSSEELAFLSVTHRLKPNGKPMRAFKRIAERLCGENILLPQPKKI